MKNLKIAAVVGFSVACYMFLVAHVSYMIFNMVSKSNTIHELVTSMMMGSFSIGVLAALAYFIYHTLIHKDHEHHDRKNEGGS